MYGTYETYKRKRPFHRFMRLILMAGPVVMTVSLMSACQSAVAINADKGVKAYLADDYATAIEKWRPPAEAGDSESQLYLGMMYFNGNGVKRNHVIAYMWANLAANQGNKASFRIRDFISSNMTKAQIAEGQRLSRECIARNYKNCAR